MPAARGGGGGSRILIDPLSLRRGARELRDGSGDLNLLAARLRGAPTPEMPPGVAAAVSGGIAEVASSLDSFVDPLADSAVELERRALWTEIADELIAGTPLTGAALAQFLAGLRDGTLVRYAEPWQAELAGRYVAGMYVSTYKDPEKLIELARLLQANGSQGEASGAFMAGFVEGFGPERMVDIPRVIQAMEWTPGMSLGSNDDSFVDWELGQELNMDGYRLPDDVDPVELLGIFSMTLALATTSGRVARDVEHDIAWDEDSWAVAQLLHDGQFGANFLKEAFQSVVVHDIMRDAARMGPDMTAYMAIGAGHSEGDSQISTDERQLVLEALLRNPEGAALALSSELPEEVHISSRWAPVETRDPIAVLYAADWEEDGRLFADLYREATTWAQSEAAEPGTSRQANEITLQLIERVSNDLRGDLGPVTDALAADIADYHVRSLFEMNIGVGEESGDSVGKGFLDLTSDRIVLDARQVEELVSAMSDREEADRIFVKGLADGQASYLAEMVRDRPDDGELWGSQVGTLNQYVLNAHDLDRTIEFGEASTNQKIGISLLGATLTGLTEGTPFGVLTGPATTLIDVATAPSELDLDNANFADKLDSRETVRALVATAFHEYGDMLGPTGEQQRYLLENGHLIAFSDDVPPAVRNEFNQWVEAALARDERLEDAIAHAMQAMDDHARN
jgi:hypothetical protein